MAFDEIYFLTSGQCKTVSPKAGTVTSTVGSDAILKWTFTNGEMAVGMKLFNGTNELYASRAGLSDLAKQLFGNRLSVDSSEDNEVVVMLKNTSLADSGMTFNLTGAFLEGQSVEQFQQNGIKLIVQGRCVLKINP